MRSGSNLTTPTEPTDTLPRVATILSIHCRTPKTMPLYAAFDVTLGTMRGELRREKDYIRMFISHFIHDTSQQMLNLGKCSKQYLLLRDKTNISMSLAIGDERRLRGLRLLLHKDLLHELSTSVIVRRAHNQCQLGLAVRNAPNITLIVIDLCAQPPSRD